MSKKNTRNTNAKRGFLDILSSIGGSTLKVVGIVLIAGAILSATLLPISLAMVNNPSGDDVLTVVSFDVENNTVELVNSNGSTTVSLLGITLSQDADLEKYIGLEVYTKADYRCGEFNDAGIQQSYIILMSTDHVLQMDMLIDGVAELSDFPSNATRYSDYWESATFGEYPEG